MNDKSKDKNFLNESIPPEIMKIINFIADKEFEYEKETQEKIKNEINTKFGEEGIKIYNDLVESNSSGIDCPECQCDEEDLISLDEDSEDVEIKDGEELKKRVSEIFSDLLKNDNNEIITFNDMYTAIKSLNSSFAETLTMNQIVEICNQIIMNGLDDGWLYDKFFEMENVPKDVIARSKEREEK